MGNDVRFVGFLADKVAGAVVALHEAELKLEGGWESEGGSQR
jgi:hypothetical protein